MAASSLCGASSRERVRFDCGRDGVSGTGATSDVPFLPAGLVGFTAVWRASGRTTAAVESGRTVGAAVELLEPITAVVSGGAGIDATPRALSVTAGAATGGT